MFGQAMSSRWGLAYVVVIAAVVGLSARTAPTSSAHGDGAASTVESGVCARTFEFLDDEDQRTLSVVDLRGRTTPGKGDISAVLSVTFRFTGRRIDPPRGYMFARGSNVQAARAMANGIENGWLK